MFGILPHQEVDPRSSYRDIRPWGMRFAGALREPINTAMSLAAASAGAFMFPAIADLCFIVGTSLFIWFQCQKVTLPLRMPMRLKLKDWSDLRPDNGKPKIGEGIFYLGNQRPDVPGSKNEELWATNSDIRTHMVVFGSTGAGKTEALISMATNALAWGSGFLYIDGKGDNSLYAKIFSAVKRAGRIDDLLVVNYMTGNIDPDKIGQEKLSNTMNPFSNGSAAFLTEMVVSLMSETGGDNAMWKDRAIGLISGLMGALCYLRDKGELLLDTGVIRSYLNFPNLWKLYTRRKEFPESVAAAIEGYVKSLPGFHEKKKENQSEDTNKQHGFLEMQFSRIMGSLSDTYGHIFKHELAEVDLEDVVLNRRILVVLLPALEKSADELRNLGNINVAAVRSMMAKTLGAKLEGDFAEVVEAKPTNSPSPYVTIFDEYGYYSVKNSAVMPAQARSLGFSMVFAGQDLQAFQKASREEAASIIANCNFKITMKLEDPTDTFEVFNKAAGQAEVSVVSGFTGNANGLVTNYMDIMNASIEKRDRLTLRELKALGPGEAVVLFGAKVIRTKMFFADPKPAKRIIVNRFLKVKPPQVIDLERGGAQYKFVKNALLSGSPDFGMVPLIHDIDVVADAFSVIHGAPVKERAIAAAMAYLKAGEENDALLEAALSGEVADLDYNLAAHTPQATDGEAVADSAEDELFAGNEIIDPSFNLFTANPINKEEVKAKIEAAQPEVAQPAATLTDDPITNVLIAGMTGIGVLPDLNREETVADLTEIETQMSGAPQEVATDAKEIAENIVKAIEYPTATLPEHKSIEQVNDYFDALSAGLENT